MFKVLSDERINELLGLRHKNSYTAVCRKVAKAQRDEDLRQFVEWGIEPCREHYEGGGVISQRECPLCWQTLPKEKK